LGTGLPNIFLYKRKFCTFRITLYYCQITKQKGMDVRDNIIAHLEKNERSLAWMVRQIEGANYHTMYSVLVQKKIKLSDLTLSKINKALQTKFKK